MTHESILTLVTALVGLWQAPAWADPPTDMVLIPAGPFSMGDSSAPFDGEADERPAHTVMVDAFYVDPYEVTNQQYADALNWAVSQGSLITVTNGIVYPFGGDTSTPYCTTTSAPTGPWNFGEYSGLTCSGATFGVVSGRGSHPVGGVSWFGAAAYANWRSAMEARPPCYDTSTWACDFGAAGYRLPTEAEWEKAARGGAAGHRFPWSDSDDIQHARANYYSEASYSYDTSPTRGFNPSFTTAGFPYTSPVGSFAPNGYGLYDMAGNVWEWCNDRYSSAYYGVSPGDNPRGPETGNYKVLRGGSWLYKAFFARCSYRLAGPPDLHYYYFGLRLVRGAAAPRAPSDIDDDGDVDLADFDVFLVCFNGPNRALAQVGCEICDFDGDGDVDLSDFGELLACFNGPNRPLACQP